MLMFSLNHDATDLIELKRIDSGGLKVSNISSTFVIVFACGYMVLNLNFDTGFSGKGTLEQLGHGYS